MTRNGTIELTMKDLNLVSGGELRDRDKWKVVTLIWTAKTLAERYDESIEIHKQQIITRISQEEIAYMYLIWDDVNENPYLFPKNQQLSPNIPAYAEAYRH